MPARADVLVIDCDGVDGGRVVRREDVVRCLGDSRRLEALVGAVLAEARVRVAAQWSVQELGSGAAGNTTTGGLFRVAGSASGDDGLRAWSLVVKVLRSPRDTGEPWDDPGDGIYWRREMNLVEAGLLESVEGLAAPRCYAVSYVSPDMCWLWLEDVGSFDRGRWSPSQYGMAARALARFHAPYLAGRPIPDYPWLNRAFLRDFHTYCEPRFRALFSAVAAAPPGGPLAELDPQRSGSPIGSLMRILEHPSEWLDLLDGLPRTLCHQDATIDNLTWRPTQDGGPEVVAIDWQMLGTGSIGSDLGQLLCELPSTLAGQSRHVVVEAVLRDYHSELRMRGVRLAWDQVHLAFAVDTVLRQGMWKLHLLCVTLRDEIEGSASTQASVGVFLHDIQNSQLPSLATHLETTTEHVLDSP